jgi:hypothetical protein
MRGPAQIAGMRRIWLLMAVIAACGGGLEPEPVCAPTLVGACGRLDFRGTIPDSTDNVFIAAYLTLPQTCNDLILNRQPFRPSSVPYTAAQTTYGVALPPGDYHWLLAVWKKQGALTLSNADTALLRVAGYYRDPADTSQRGVVTVPAGSFADSINFVVDFDQLRPATDFVTCSAR